MLEINKWFFAQLANFLILLILLNIILFKPLLNLFRERKAGTSGALDDAKKLGQQKDELTAQIDAKLAEGRNKAKAAYEELSREGVEHQRQALSAAQKEAADLNSKAKADLQSAAEKARTSLRADIENFSKQIVEKLVKA